MPRRCWLAALAALVAVNVRAARRHEGTFSHAVVRETFRTDTHAGRLVFVAAWAVLTAWFIPHILRWPRDRPRPSSRRR